MLAGLFCMVGIVSHGARLDPHALSVAQGELLCLAYETYLGLVAEPRISFEHAAFLVLALAHGDELTLSHCNACGALIDDRYALRATPAASVPGRRGLPDEAPAGPAMRAPAVPAAARARRHRPARARRTGLIGAHL